MGLFNFIKSVVESIKSAISKHVDEAETKTNCINVKNVSIVKPFDFDVAEIVTSGEIKKEITLKKDAHFQLDIERFANMNNKKKWRKAKMDVFFEAGFKTNGASAPEFFKLQLPAYIDMDDDNAQKYNAAAFIHDGLYACKGVIEEEGIPNEQNDKNRYTLTRMECDNILSCVWVESKFVDPVTAKIAEKAVNVAAGGPEHWDNDDFRCKEHFSITIKYLE